MRHLKWAAGPLAVLAVALAGCGASDGKVGTEGAPATSDKTLGALIKDDRAFGTLETVLNNAGLATVLDGAGPYTVFAPADGAFKTSGQDFTGEAMKAPGAALLRSHIVPGTLTRRDIEAAIARDADGKVEMRTMGEGMLTFSRDGDLLTVTAPDGAAASLNGQETVAANGVLQPIDGLLVK